MSGFQSIIAAWNAAIQIALDDKASRFGKDATDGRLLLTGPYDWMYNGAGGDRHFSYQGNRSGAFQYKPSAPGFRITFNKVAELVQLFGPALYHKNPHRQVTPRKPFVIDGKIMNMMAQSDINQATALAQFMFQGVQQSSMDEVNTQLMGAYLNATPYPLSLYLESRRAIDEALVTGCGVMWTESYVPDGAQARVVGSFQDTEQNLILDTGMPTPDRAKWAARRRVVSLADAAKKFGIDPERLRPACTIESRASTAVVNSSGGEGLNMRARRASYDTIVYYEIYSRCGLGAQMKNQLSPEAKAICDTFADDFAYLCIAPNLDFPLNCPPEMFNQANTPDVMNSLKQRFAWPIPFWADGSWPFTMIHFHEIPGEVWPMSHLAPAMGELKFLNWFYSFIVGKIFITSRTFMAVKKSANQAVKEALQNGSDLALIELEAQSGVISEIVQWLDHPEINGDVFKVADIIEHQFEKRTGMTELQYGFSSRQYRSAAEAEIKNEATNVRPDDMANKVEEQMSSLARKEAIAARFTLQGQDVSFMCGPIAGQLWDMYTVTSDPRKAIYETDYRIEAGSIRKPNRSRDAENMTAFVQQFAAFYQQLAGMGINGPYNQMLADWCKVRDMDPSGYEVNLPPPMPPAPGQAQGGSPPA